MLCARAILVPVTAILEEVVAVVLAHLLGPHQLVKHLLLTLHRREVNLKIPPAVKNYRMNLTKFSDIFIFTVRKVG